MLNSPKKKKVTRQEAIKLGLKRYFGKLCQKHNTRERGISRGECVECHRERGRQYSARMRKENPEKRRKIYNDWRKRHPYGNKSAVLKYNFGITFTGYKQILKSQNYGCAICGKRKNTKDVRTGKPRMLAVDHDHKTGKIRGLLCDLHNRGLGMFQDNSFLLKKAIQYLKIHGGKNVKGSSPLRRHQNKNQASSKRTPKRVSTRS